MDDDQVREAVAKVLPISNKTFEIWCGRRGGEVSYRDPLTSVDTCIAAWRELSEEQQHEVEVGWFPSAIMYTADFLSESDAARILATAIAEEVTP